MNYPVSLLSKMSFNTILAICEASRVTWLDVGYTIFLYNFLFVVIFLPLMSNQLNFPSFSFTVVTDDRQHATTHK